MIWKQVDTCTRGAPVSISLLIDVANAFDCDIFVKCDERQVNVKIYDELKDNLKTCEKKLMFMFNGKDEQDAGQKIERIFHN